MKYDVVLSQDWTNEFCIGLGVFIITVWVIIIYHNIWGDPRC
jgi:hypothetical protein